MRVNFWTMETRGKRKGTQTLTATLTIANGEVKILSGDAAWAKTIVEMSAVRAPDGAELTPANGDAYLRGLANLYTGTYVRAEIVE